MTAVSRPEASCSVAATRVHIVAPFSGRGKVTRRVSTGIKHPEGRAPHPDGGHAGCRRVM